MRVHRRIVNQPRRRITCIRRAGIAIVGGNTRTIIGVHAIRDSISIHIRGTLINSAVTVIIHAVTGLHNPLGGIGRGICPIPQLAGAVPAPAMDSAIGQTRAGVRFTRSDLNGRGNT
jgi:hypothetical protein